MIKLKDIRFPVYLIKKPNRLIRTNDTGELLAVLDDDIVGVVDDPSIPGTSLGIRRLKARELDIKLYPLTVAYNTLSSLVTKTNNLFVDSNGRSFNYIPSIMVKLKWYEVRTQVILEGKKPLVYLKGLPRPIRLDKVLEEGVWYLGIALLDGNPILYDISRVKHKDTWRKV